MKTGPMWTLSMLVVVAAAGPARADDPLARATALNEKLFVFDAHADTVLSILKEGRDLGKANTEGHIDIPRMRAGGLDAQVFAMWPEEEYWDGHAAKRVLQMADALFRTIRANPDDLELALCAADAERIHAQGKIAAFLGIEGGYAIEDDLALLRMFHRLGVRVMTLTWMKNTSWADASSDEPKHGGLTPFGRQVVQEMNRLGMVVDVSHVADKTFFDVLAVSRAPVIASHSCTRAICPYHRNLTDDMLRALAKNGGVIGINYFTGFLDAESNAAFEALWDELEPLWQKYKHDLPTYRKLRQPIADKHLKGLKPVTIEKLVDHIDHAVKVAGIDHVGLGSDFDGISYPPEGLDDVSKLPLVTAALLRRGYSEADLKKILGGNLLRVFRQAIDERPTE